jgi:glycosyltransferase involved in cell wall biosynthesis
VTDIARSQSLPRITVVTPVYNGAHYIEDTINSILNQGYPNLEYIIVDGASTDGTVDIIRKYEKYLTWWVSRPDAGMYEALNTGFERSTGEVMGWLNASDMLHPKGLFVVGGAFAALREVEWITGRVTVLDPSGMTVYVLDLARWSRYRFLAGANEFIQQESTFWRRTLWERAGGALDTRYPDSGDFELWVRYFRHAQLHSIDALIGAFRKHPDGIFVTNPSRYRRHCEEIIERELESVEWRRGLRSFRKLNGVVQRIPKVRRLWRSIVIKLLYRCPGPDLPSVIVFKDDGWAQRR